MSIAPIGDVFWLQTRDEEAPLGTIVPQIAALTKFASEIDGRIVAAGMGGLEGAVAVYEQLRSVLAGIAVEDLQRMTAQVAHLQQELMAIDRRLVALRDLKKTLDLADPAG